MMDNIHILVILSCKLLIIYIVLFTVLLPRMLSSANHLNTGITKKWFNFAMVFIQCIAHFLTILSLVQVRISAAILFLSVFHISMSLNNTVVFFVV